MVDLCCSAPFLPVPAPGYRILLPRNFTALAYFPACGRFAFVLYIACLSTYNSCGIFSAYQAAWAAALASYSACSPLATGVSGEKPTEAGVRMSPAWRGWRSCRAAWRDGPMPLGCLVWRDGTGVAVDLWAGTQMAWWHASGRILLMIWRKTFSSTVT